MGWLAGNRGFSGSALVICNKTENTWHIKPPFFCQYNKIILKKILVLPKILVHDHLHSFTPIGSPLARWAAFPFGNSLLCLPLKKRLMELPVGLLTQDQSHI
jgi:hypothetical protein